MSLKSTVILASVGAFFGPFFFHLSFAQAPCGNYPLDATKQYCYKGFVPVELGKEICENNGTRTEFNPATHYCSNGVVAKQSMQVCADGRGVAAQYDPQKQFCYKGQPAEWGMKFCEYPGGRMHVFAPRKGETCNGTVYGPD